MRRLSAALGLLNAVLWAGCGGGANEGGGGRTVVKLMGWGDTTTEAKYKILVDAFEKANPDIEVAVQILDVDSYSQKLPVMVASGTAPDILECSPEVASSFPTLARNGAFVDLGLLVRRDGVDLGQWFESVIQRCRYHGTLYILPKKLNNPACLHYNMDLFDAAGLPYPSRDWTWQDALELARKLTKDLDGDGRPDQWGLSAPLAIGNDAAIMRGWTPIKANGREVSVDDPVFYESLQWMADLMNVHHVAPSMEQSDASASSGLPSYLLFTTGKVGMQAEGRWATALYKREVKDRFRWDTVWLPIPEKGAQRRYVIGSEAWGINRGSKVVEPAWKVLKWFSGPDGSRVLGRMGEIPAIRAVAYSSDFLDSTPPSRQGNLMWLEAMDYAVGLPLEPEWARIDQMMTQTFQLGWYGQRPFKDLALEVKPKLDAILQEEE